MTINTAENNRLDGFAPAPVAKKVVKKVPAENVSKRGNKEQHRLDNPVETIHTNVVPNNHVNLCFVGGVSTGKSTGLNGVFCQKLTDCKIKRTTMVPTVYVEHAQDEIAVIPDEIFQQIADKNKELIEKSESGQVLSANDYDETVFNVGKLDIRILDDALVNIYDIPGLNDARTKNIYYAYLEKQFHKFNVILFFVDINSGLNTSDEMDILKFIATNTRTELHHKGRKIYTLVIVNKADDMQLDANGKLILIGEMAEMFEQVESTVKGEFDKNEISSQLLGIIPFCALDAYLYRMVKKYGENFKLTPQQIQKIGVNEMGKKFSTLKSEIQEEKVYEILKDQEFIDSMIQLSGFSTLETMLRKCMMEDGLGKQLQIDNLLQELKGLSSPSIAKMWGKRDASYVELVENYWNLFQKIGGIDKTKSVELIAEFLESIKQQIVSTIMTRPLSKLVDGYDYFVSSYIGPYFGGEYYDTTSYPEYFVKSILLRLRSEWFSCASLAVNGDTASFIGGFKIIERLGQWNRETVESVVGVIISNTYGFNSIKFEGTTDCELLVELLRTIEPLEIPSFKKLVRFLLLNYYANYQGTTDEYHRRVMLYRSYREVPICYYLESKLMSYPATASIEVYMEPIDITQSKYSLDMFYLEREYL